MNDSSAESCPTYPRPQRPRGGKLRSGSFVTALVVAVAATVAACQRESEPPPPVATAYAADIDALCNAVERSGAGKLGPSERTVVIAMWLGDHVTTAEARQFLVRTQPLVGDARADALEAEQRRVGLPSCPLAAVWRASATASAAGAAR